MILCPLPGRDWRITQRFPDRPEHYAKYGLRGHGGIDFAPRKAGTKGMVVYAPHDGYIDLKSFKTGFGRHLYITSQPYDEGTRRQSVLAHLEKYLVKQGQFISQGDPVAIMGGGKGMSGAGDSTNVHLHWGFRRVDAAGNVLDKNNGFNGFVDVSGGVLYWSGATLR